MQVLKKSQITEKKFVAADLEKCTGCGVCELICALKREKVYNPRLSRIKILRLYRLANLSIACKFCENAPCVTACPLDSLVQSETGVILVDEDKCDCCGWCMEACPYGAVVLNPEKQTVMMCDLCDGEPQCVEWCPEEALALVTQKEFDANLRKATADKLIDHEQGEQRDRKERDNTGFLNEEKNESLNLLVEAFSEPKPIDILIYGMYVKKHLACMVSGLSTAKIEKTLKWLGNAINVAEKSGKQ